MAPRPHWKGYLKLSLVSCPIALYPAISAAERVSFRQVNRQTGNRLRQQLVDSVTGEVVDPYDKARGYEVGENRFVVVEEHELDAARQEARTRPYSAAPASQSAPPVEDVAPTPPRGERAKREGLKQEALPVAPPAPPQVRIENTRTIDIERFVPHDQIDPRYYDTPYYIAPRDEVGLEAFAVIRDAMRGKELLGMGRVVLAKRERPIIIEPMGNGLRGMTLRYAHEVRNEAEYFADIPEIALPEDILRIAEHILVTKTENFDPAYLEDRYRTVLVSKLRERQAALPRKISAPAPSRQNVINLMDALKRSLSAEQSNGEKAAPPRKRPAASSKSSRYKRSGSRKAG
jgi:Ku protein